MTSCHLWHLVNLHWPTIYSVPLSLLTFIPFWIITLPHFLYALQTLTGCRFLLFTLPLHLMAFLLQPPQSGTHFHLAFVTLPLPILSIAFLKLTASSRPSAAPSGSPKCLRFGHWLTLCTLKIHLLTYTLLLFALAFIAHLHYIVVCGCIMVACCAVGCATRLAAVCHSHILPVPYSLLFPLWFLSHWSIRLCCLSSGISSASLSCTCPSISYL